MGRVSELAMDIEEADEMRELLSSSARSRHARSVSVINRQIGELFQIANTTHHQLGAVPGCLPLDGNAIYQLRQVRLTIDAILRADERSAGAAA